MMISFKIPPGSSFRWMLPKIIGDLGFIFNVDLVADVHSDGTIVEYAPCPPPDAS